MAPCKSVILTEGLPWVKNIKSNQIKSNQFVSLVVSFSFAVYYIRFRLVMCIYVYVYVYVYMNIQQLASNQDFSFFGANGNIF